MLQFDWSSCVKKAKPNTISLFIEIPFSMGFDEFYFLEENQNIFTILRSSEESLRKQTPNFIQIFANSICSWNGFFMRHKIASCGRTSVAHCSVNTELE